MFLIFLFFFLNHLDQRIDGVGLNDLMHQQSQSELLFIGHIDLFCTCERFERRI